MAKPQALLEARLTRSFHEGAVHGRYQPLHLRHLEIMVAARKSCDFLWVGITQPVVSALRAPAGAAAHRAQPESNLLSYYERASIIQEALTDASVEPTTFGITPFPIETPRQLPEFLPTHVTMYINICEDWGRVKAQLLRDMGYRVEILWENEKDLSGEMVRAMILAGDPAVERVLPPASFRAVQRLHLKDRMLPAKETSTGSDTTARE